MRAWRSTCRGACHSTRYVPPAGFGYPLGGLRPPSPCRPCFVPAALMGFALRSFLLTEGTRRVSAGENPRAVFSVGFPWRRSAWAGPTDRGLWAFTLPGVPRGRRSVSAAHRRMLPWALPSQGVPVRALHELAPALLPRASRIPVSRPVSAAPRSFNQPQPDPSHSGEPVVGRATLAGFQHRISPQRSSEAPPGLLGSPCAASYIAADRPTR
jgi:hypothetical protein